MIIVVMKKNGFCRYDGNLDLVFNDFIVGIIDLSFHSEEIGHKFFKIDELVYEYLLLLVAKPIIPMSYASVGTMCYSVCLRYIVLFYCTV